MLAAKSLEKSPKESENLIRHRAMYERRLRELARSAPPEEELSDDVIAKSDSRANHKIANEMAIA